MTTQKVVVPLEEAPALLAMLGQDASINVRGEEIEGRVVRVEAVKTSNASEASVWIQMPEPTAVGS